ncbi:MAG: CoA transferase [Thermoanaerobaculia bacterium]|mgnify:CR=1 FL=1|nr:CoA transferase [Thermoanaerobaculia bacterium]
MSARPLAGLRVLELGQILAGPFAGAMLAYFGADVVKVEPPGSGDPIRTWRLLDDDGTSLWWRSLGRNKRCVTLDLATPEGQALARRLAGRADVLIENFRPGTMEGWGLSPERLQADNPGLVVARISGFGQSGPYAARPGYASVCEAFGGLRHLTGNPGEVPLRANLSLGDSLAGLHAVVGILLALEARRRDGRGQVVDAAIFESVFNILESVVPEFDRAGAVRGPSGPTVSGIVPSNAYPAADGEWVVIGANNSANFRRLMEAIGRADLGADPELAENPGRLRRQAELDAAIGGWTRTLAAAEVVDRLVAVAVPASTIYTVADMFADPHYRARGLFEQVEAAGRQLALPAMLPRLSASPGRTDWAGPELGAHNLEIFCGELGLAAEELAELHRRGVV